MRYVYTSVKENTPVSKVRDGDIKEVMYYSWGRGGSMAERLIATTEAVRDTGYGARNLPALVASAGGDAQKRFIEFFAAQIRNKNTREAYIRAVVDCHPMGGFKPPASAGSFQPPHVA